MPSNEMDQECVALCAAINKIPGLRTVESCCGHGERPFRIWFDVDTLDFLPILLYYCDPCHVGFRWDCYVDTDCAMSPVTFLLESQVKGAEAYGQAERIAREIEDALAEGILNEFMEEEEEVKTRLAPHLKFLFWPLTNTIK